jgi:sulfatase maturation enzyme AslB (radical SAM superfamily)
MGGEPFMMKQVVYILQRIVDLGAAKNIILSISTNATIRNELLCEIFTQFKSVALSISVDGTEEVAEYIRYPSKWKMVESNISRLKQIENAYAFVNMTLQVYNMFHVTPVAQFCEDMNIDFRYHLMTRPACLHHQCMPLDVRQAAANKIRQFNLDMSKDRFQGRVIDTNSVLDEIAGLLESNSGPTDPAMVEQFMEFTNDLDASRGQSFSAANGELADLLGKSGFPWSDRRRFTTCDTGAAPL